MSNVSFGPGCLAGVARLLDHIGARRVLLVTGRSSYATCGAEAALAPAWSGRVVTQYFDFAPNPRLEDLERGLAAFEVARPDVVVAVGGGSVLDMAKLIDAFGSSGASPRPPFDSTALATGRPLVALPTTAGSGAEVTPFAVIYVDGIKYSVDHATLRPMYAFVDPDLLRGTPAALAASTGMDALAQAVESYWSVAATGTSRALAIRALHIVFGHLEHAVRRPSPSSAFAMAEGAHLAGQAIALTRTTACHALSYPFTSRFGVPHGHAVALTLPAMFTYLAATSDDAMHPAGAAHVKGSIEALAAVFGAADGAGARRVLEALMDSIGLERRLSRLGVVTTADRALILDEGFNVARTRNHPRAISRDAIAAMLESLG